MNHCPTIQAKSFFLVAPIWFGTVIYDAWPRVVLNMAWATAFCVWVRYQTHGDYQVFNMDAHALGDNSKLVSAFTIADKLWSTPMSVTTFLLTFFVGQVYNFWKSFIDVGRSIQGRSHAVVHTHAAVRNPKTGSYNPEAALSSRHGQAAQASQARRIRVLLADKGWDQIVARGMVSEEERKILMAVNLGPTNKQIYVLQRMITVTQKAMRDTNVIGLQYTSMQKR